MKELKVSFEAVELPNGTGPLDIVIIVPKSHYIVSAEDNGAYYIKPVESLSSHQQMQEEH